MNRASGDSAAAPWVEKHACDPSVVQGEAPSIRVRTVFAPTEERPENENTISVRTLHSIPSSSHMDLDYLRHAANTIPRDGSYASLL
jgi:hypothetical protein